MAHPLASMVRANLNTATRIKYRMEAEDNLSKRTLFHMFGVARPLERGHSTQQLHRFNLGQPNTDTLQENEIGAGSSFTDSIFSMTPARYGDFVVITQEFDEEVYSNWQAGMARALGSRAALTIDRVCRALFDAAPAGAQITSPRTSQLSRELIGQVTSLMAEATVEPVDNGYFAVITSPICAYDMLFDTAAGEIAGLADSLSTSEIKKGATSMLLTVTAGAKVYGTTEVAQPSSSTRRCYAFGANGWAYTHFAGSAPQFGTKSPRNFDLIVHRTPKGSINDPIGRIRASFGFRFSLAVASLDTTDYRYRIFTVSPVLAS